MSWRITASVFLVVLAGMVTAYWNRPLSLLTTTKISLDGYTNIELLGESSWTMSKEADWSSIHPIRARLSSSQVEQWIRLLEQVQPCLAPKGVPSHTIRFTQSSSDLTLDLPVWFDVVGPAKIQFEGVWYSVSSEVLEPIRFGLAPFRTSQLLPLALSPTTIKIKVGNSTSLELVKSSSWSVREPLLAPADAGAIQTWLEAVESKSAGGILGHVSQDQAELLSGLFPVAAELILVGDQSVPGRSIRFGKRLPDGSRLAQVQGEDVIFVVRPEDAAFMLPSPTRFLVPTCTTLVPERVHTIVVAQQAERRNRVTGRFGSSGERLLELLTSTPATNFALASSFANGVIIEAFDRSGETLYSGEIQIEGNQVAVWSDGLARILPLDDDLVSWIQEAVGTTDQDQSSSLPPVGAS